MDNTTSLILAFSLIAVIYIIYYYYNYYIMYYRYNTGTVPFCPPGMYLIDGICKKDDECKLGYDTRSNNCVQRCPDFFEEKENICKYPEGSVDSYVQLKNEDDIKTPYTCPNGYTLDEPYGLCAENTMVVRKDDSFFEDGDRTPKESSPLIPPPPQFRIIRNGVCPPDYPIKEKNFCMNIDDKKNISIMPHDRYDYSMNYINAIENECPVNYEKVDFGGLKMCFKKCMPGYKSMVSETTPGFFCNKQCPPDMTPHGNHCRKNIYPKPVQYGTLLCGDGEELIDGKCYKVCKNGYISGTYNNNLICKKV